MCRRLNGNRPSFARVASISKSLRHAERAYYIAGRMQSLVIRDFWIGEVCRDVGGGDAFAAFDAGSHFEVEVEELQEEVVLRGESGKSD